MTSYLCQFNWLEAILKVQDHNQVHDRVNTTTHLGVQVAESCLAQESALVHTLQSYSSRYGLHSLQRYDHVDPIVSCRIASCARK